MCGVSPIPTVGSDTLTSNEKASLAGGFFVAGQPSGQPEGPAQRMATITWREQPARQEQRGQQEPLCLREQPKQHQQQEQRPEPERERGRVLSCCRQRGKWPAMRRRAGTCSWFLPWLLAKNLVHYGGITEVAVLPNPVTTLFW
jgi:hypothetical protein